ncbi:SDR family oxidoreductase [Dietzia lutea]|nr:SDR family oxidoreductase [Dietzia lutea]
MSEIAPQPTSSTAPSLVGRIALVTGGAAGVGAAIAKALAEAGARVWVADLDSDSERGTEPALGVDGSITQLRCDVSRADDVRATVDAVVKAEGGVDILVNNAGVMGRTGPLDDWESSLEDFERIVAVNLRGPFLFGRAVAPLMVQRGGGDIVMMSTDHVHTCGWPRVVSHDDSPECPWSASPRPPGALGMDIYDATKWGLHGFTHDWAKELQQHRVRVNNICLGATDSRMIRAFSGYADYDPPPEVIAAWQRPEAVAGVIVDLLLEGPSGRSGDNIGLWRGHPTVLPPADPLLNVNRDDD